MSHKRYLTRADIIIRWILEWRALIFVFFLRHPSLYLWAKDDSLLIMVHYYPVYFEVFVELFYLWSLLLIKTSSQACLFFLFGLALLKYYLWFIALFFHYKVCIQTYTNRQLFLMQNNQLQTHDCICIKFKELYNREYLKYYERFKDSKFLKFQDQSILNNPFNQKQYFLAWYLCVWCHDCEKS